MLGWKTLARRVRAARVAGLVAVGLAVAGAPAPAADPAVLKADIETILKAMTAAAQQDGVLTVQGGVTVETRGDQVVATLPGLSFGAPGDKSGVTLGPVRMALRALGTDLHRVELTVPDRYEIRGPDGQAAMVVTIGAQDMTGVFRTSIQLFESLSMALEQVTLALPGGQKVAEIARVSATGGVKETAPGVWNGTFRFAADGVAGSTPDGLAVQVGSVYYDTALKDARLAEYARLGHEAGISLTNPLWLDPQSMTLDNWVKLFDAVAMAPDLFGGVSLLYGVKDVSVGPPGQPPMVSARAAAFGFGVAGDGNDGLSLSLGLEFADIGLPPQLPIPVEAPRELMPHSVDLRIELDHIPAGPVWDRFFTAFRERIAAARPAAGGQAPAAPLEAVISKALEAAAGMTAPEAMAALQAARPQLHLRNLSVRAPEARIDAAGRVKYAPDAAHMAVGGLDLRLSGLDELIQRFGRSPGNQTEAMMVVGLTFLRGLAVVQPAQNGRTAHAIRVELAEDGTVLANGVDAVKLVELLDQSRGRRGGQRGPRGPRR